MLLGCGPKALWLKPGGATSCLNLLGTSEPPQRLRFFFICKMRDTQCWGCSSAIEPSRHEALGSITRTMKEEKEEEKAEEGEEGEEEGRRRRNRNTHAKHFCKNWWSLLSMKAYKTVKGT